MSTAYATARTVTVDLSRSPYLSAALDYISENPGCTKWDAVHLGDCHVPSRTRAYRYSALDRLLRAGLVEDRSEVRGRYALYAVDATHETYHICDMPAGTYNELASHLRGRLLRDGVTIDRNMEGQVILSGERVTPRHRTMVRSMANTMLQHG